MKIFNKFFNIFCSKKNSTAATFRYSFLVAERLLSVAEVSRSTKNGISMRKLFLALAFLGLSAGANAQTNVANIAAFKALPDNTTATVTGTVTVVYQNSNGNNLFVQDASGWLLIYGSTVPKTFNNGDQITGVSGTRLDYGTAPGNYPELALNNGIIPDGIAGTPAVPALLTPDVLTYDDQNRYVVFENVQIAANVTYSTSVATDGTIVTNSGTMTIRDNYRLFNKSFTAGDIVSLKGIVRSYNNVIQIYLLEIELKQDGFVINGDFSAPWTSGIPAGWRSDVSAFTITQGNSYFAVQNTTATTKLYQEIPVTAGVTYTLSFEYTANYEKFRIWSGFTSTSGGGLTFLTGDATTDPLRTNNLYFPIASTFTKKTIIFTVPAGQNLFRLEFRYYTQAGSIVELKNVKMTKSTVPENPAPTPTVPAANVLSVFSDSYTAGAPQYTNWWFIYGNWGQQTTHSIVQIGGVNTLLLNNFNYQGLEFIQDEQGKGILDVSQMTTLHLDIWSPEITSFAVDIGSGYVTLPALTPGQWNSIDIPLSKFTGVNLANVMIMGLSAKNPSSNTTAYIQNIYFYKDGISPAIIASGYCGGEGDGKNLTWTLTADSVLTISGTGAMKDYWVPSVWGSTGDAVYAPWFSYRNNIKSVVIQNGATLIGSTAFYDCSRLISVTIPNSVTTLNGGAFYGCRSLTTVTISNLITTIGMFAFSNCTGLTAINVNINNPNYCSDNGILFDKNKTILIQYPTSKTGTYTIPNTVTTIELVAFQYCSGLTSITIPNSVTSIKWAAFWNCTSLTDIYVSWATPPDIYYNNTDVFYGVTTQNVRLHIPQNRLSTYQAAPVWQNFQLVADGAVMPTTVFLETCGNPPTTSGSTLVNVYNGWDNVGNVSYYSTIGNADVRRRSTIIPHVWFPANINSDLVIDSISTAGYSNLKLTFDVAGESNINNVILEVNDVAITVPSAELNGITGAFVSSGEISIPNSTTVKLRFYCTATNNTNGFRITNIKIAEPNSTTTFDASNITYTQATLNGKVSNGAVINGFEYKLLNETNYTSINVNSPNTSISYTLNNLQPNSLYQFRTFCNYYGGIIYGETKSFSTPAVTRTWQIGSPNAADVIATLNLLDSTLTISGTGAMADFTSGTAPWYSQRAYIKTLVIQNGVTTIGGYALEDCSNLTSVTISNSVTSIGYYGFYNCSGLTSVEIPYSVTTMYNSSFWGCNSLTAFNVDINNSKYSSDNGVLFNTNKTTLLLYPPGKIGNYTIPNWVTSIGQFAFAACSSLTSVTIPISVTTIGNYAFYGCSGLTSVTIPSSVTTIGDFAFQICTGLTDIYVSWTTPPSIGSDVFYGVTTQNVRLHIPQNRLSIYQAAAVWQNFQLVSAQTITWNQTLSANYGNSPITLNATASSGLPIIYESSNTGVATINGNILNIVGVGVSNITAKQAGNTNYDAAASIIKTITVNKGVQTITWNQTLSTTYGDSPITLNASTNSGLSITYTSSNTNVATINGNILTVVSAGTTTIIASQAGNSEWNNATVENQLAVNKKALTVTANNASMTYGDNPPTYTCQFAGFVNGETSSVLTVQPIMSCSANATSNVGTYPIVPSGAAAQNYNFTYQNGTLTIGKRDLTVTPNNVSRIYGNANPAFTFAYNGFVNGDNASIITTSPTAATTATTSSPVGNYNITCSGGNAANYNLVYGTGTLSITKAALTAVADNKSRVYGANNPAFTVTYTGFKNGENQSVINVLPQATCSAIAVSNVGDYTITVSGGDATNYDFSYQNGTLTINKASVTITANNASMTYGDNPPTYTCQFAGFVNGETSSVLTTQPVMSCSASATSNVGNYAIIPSGAAAQNYNFTYQNGTLTIGKRDLTVTPNNVSRIYGNANPAFTFAYNGFVNGDNASVITTSPTAVTTATVTSPVGDYNITCSGGNAANYNLVYGTGTLSITKAALTAVADNKSRVYGANNPAFTVTYTGFKNGENQSVINILPQATCSAIAVSNVGDYTITVSGGDATNYDFSYQNGTLTINKASVTITANNASMTYGDNPPTYTCQFAGFVNGETSSVLTTQPVMSCSASATSNVGTYPIVPSGATAQNYSFTYQNGTLTIGKRNLTGTPNNVSRVYGDANPAFTFAYNGFVNGDNASVITTSPTAATTATVTSPVGDYNITCSGGNAANYSFIYGTGTLTVTKRQIQAIPDNAQREYGDANPVFTLSYNGFVNGDDASAVSTAPTAISTATQTSNTGTYNITCSGGNAANYSFSYGTGTLTITKAPLTITADNVTRPQGQPNPIFTLSYSGFKNSENSSVLDYLPVATCAANESTMAGNYEIVLSGGSDNNYSYTLVNGTLTITETNTVENITIQNIIIYPNPVKDELRIESGELKINSVEICDIAGRTVGVLRATPLHEDSTTINVSHLPHGVYFVKIYTDKGVVTKKVVKN